MKLFALAAIAAALATPVMAQTSPAPAPAAQPAPTVSPAEGTMFYSKQYEWRATKLIGTRVTNDADQSIGDINDVLLDKDGKVAAVIIGVGGFLGVGERNVAVAYAALQLARDASGNPVVKINTTQEALKAAPEWKWQVSSAL